MQTTQLFNDAGYKQRVQLILANLDVLQSDIEYHDKVLESLCAKLDKVHSFPVFFAVAEEIIQAERGASQFLLEKMSGLNRAVKESIIESIQGKKELQPFSNVLNFNNIITNNILKNKERLSLDLMKETLSDDDYKIAEKFIARINALKPIAELIEKQKSEFRTKLRSVELMDEISEIEHQIDEQDHAFSHAYQALIEFPESEKIAGALVHYLEANEHLKGIMESFDFAESLTDDILDAKSGNSFGLSGGS